MNRLRGSHRYRLVSRFGFLHWISQVYDQAAIIGAKLTVDVCLGQCTAEKGGCVPFVPRKFRVAVHMSANFDQPIETRFNELADDAIHKVWLNRIRETVQSIVVHTNDTKKTPVSGQDWRRYIEPTIYSPVGSSSEGSSADDSSVECGWGGCVLCVRIRTSEQWTAATKSAFEIVSKRGGPG